MLRRRSWSVAWFATSIAACSAPSVPPSALVPSLDHMGAFSAPNDHGDLTRLPDPASRATVLDFWATSCEPCRHTLPRLAREAPALERDGVAVVLVGVLDGGESIDTARATLRAWGVEREFIIDRGGGVQRVLGVDRFPATLVLDRAGVVRWAAPPGTRADVIAAAARRVARTQGAR